MAERFLIKEVPMGSNGAVLESQKKLVARNERLKKEEAKLTMERKKEWGKIKHDLKMRTYQYEKEYRMEKEELVKLRREAREMGGYYKEPDAKLLFIVRLKGINKLAPKPKKVLQLFRLRQIHNGVFMRVNKAVTQMLKLVEPFVTYGYPTLSTIRRLIYKRGYARVGPKGSRQRIRIRKNQQISEQLGKFGIHGMEDLVHEIYTVGPHFKEASNFLWTFKLNTPNGGFISKRHGFAEARGGDWGNREKYMNDFLRTMI